MVLATLEEEKNLGLVTPPPGVPEIKPETRVVKLAKVDSNSYRRLIPWDETKMAKVKKVLKEAYLEWKENTRLQNNKLRRAVDRMEGISDAKEYPWPNSSNINIPYTEIQILVATDICAGTMLDSDPVYFVREMLPARKDRPEEHVDPKIEHWLNWVFKKQTNLDEETRMAILLAFRDPVSFQVIDWVEEIPKEYSVQVFDNTEDFLARFPNAKDAGVPQETYDAWLGQLGIAHEPLELEICERVVRYRGPKARTVELKDFVRYPVACPDLKYTIFHGDQFRERKAYFKFRAKMEQFYKAEVTAMLEKPGKKTAIDDISQQLDNIEGISSSRKSPDEYDCIRGNLKIDLDGDDEEEMYHVVYNPESEKLLRLERYPYWHNRSNYVPYRIRRKPNRLLGRCFMDMLFDINEEINTQHNQRIDSRTITTVPTFKIQSGETDLITSIDRGDRHFYPGQKFVLGNLKNMEMLETKVDFQGTLAEEQNLMGIGDMLTGTGSSGVRSGKEASKDPRASGKKTQQLIGQSNQRIDGYNRELKPSMVEGASQVIELYYQFSPDSVIEYANYDESTDAWVRNEIQRNKLRNRNMTIEVARTSVLDSPDSVLQRALTDYQIWKDEPLVGMNIQRRWELVRDTMFAERKKNIGKLLPPLKQLLAEMQQQDALNGGQPDENGQPPETSHQKLLAGVQGGGGNKPNGKRQGSKDLRPSQLDRSQKGA
jgi:hypothetical protein